MRNKKNEIFVKLTNDSLFLATFGLKCNRHFLEDFLETYFNYPKHYLKDKLTVDYVSSTDKKAYFNKISRCDLLISFDNIVVNPEIYQEYNEEAKLKSEMYAFNISANQIQKGNTYKSIKKVIQINFIGKSNIEISEDYKSTVTITENIKQEFIQLGKLPNKGYNENERFIKYLKIFNAKSYEERENIAKGDELLMEMTDWVKGYTNDEENSKYYSRDYWNERIFKLSGEKRV